MSDANPVFRARPLRVLVADDDPRDAALTATALRRHAVGSEVHVVHDGGAALEYLRQGPRFPVAPRPDLVLLDLRMPVVDGLGVLEVIKSDEALKSIPVVVLSGMAEAAHQAYELQAASFVTKPDSVDGYDDVLKVVSNFWLRVALIPGAGP